MIDLFVADLQRLLWRLLLRALGLTAVIAIAVIGVANFLQSAGKHRFNVFTGLRPGFAAATVLLVLAGFSLGASSFGADCASRALTTLLTWEPRRSRVLAARAASCAAVTACFSLAALALLFVALLPAALAHGNGAVPTSSWYLSLASLALRCALLAAAAAAIGVSCAAIGRSTAAALATMAVYLLAVEYAMTGAWLGLSRWLIVTDALSWVAVSPHTRISGPSGRAAGHTIVTGGLLLLAAVLALHALATWLLTHRDVT